MFIYSLPGAEISSGGQLELKCPTVQYLELKCLCFLYLNLKCPTFCNWIWNVILSVTESLMSFNPPQAEISPREHLEPECSIVHEYLELKCPPLGTRWPDSWGSSWFAVAASQSRTAKKRTINFFWKQCLRIFCFSWRFLLIIKLSAAFWLFLWTKRFRGLWVICFVGEIVLRMYMA